MKIMRKEKIKTFCISTFLAGIVFSGTVFATDLNIQTTKEFNEWNNLVVEEKEQTLMPKTYSPEIPDEFWNDAIRTEIPSLINQLKLISCFDLDSNKAILENVEASYRDTSYNIANQLNLRVEHQGSTTECWAFSMIKSLETNIALRTGTKEIPNFSERHMDYATSKTFTDGINEDGFSREVGTGGLPVSALAYLVNGQGAVLEEDMPFEDNEQKISLSEIDKEVDTVVTEYVTLPTISKKYTKDANGNTTNVTYYDANGNKYSNQEVKVIRDEIKKHIIEHGAVPSLTAGNYKKYYNYPKDITKASAYNCNDTNISRDHGITIVGWDDNYSRENFAEGAKPSTDGAYIVLNSYGEENFDSGYLYISYEDFFIESELHGITNTSKKDYDKIYQSDFYGGIFSMGTKSTDTGYYANVYERDSSKVEIITDVGVTVSDYVSLEIYINPENDSMDSEKLIKVGQSSEILEPGYHKIDITPTQLSGSKFTVVVKQKSQNDAFYFSIESPVENTAYACVDSDNNSYYSLDGERWKNIADVEISGFDMKKSDVCIKAFTVGELPDSEDKDNNDDENKDDQNNDNTDNDNDGNTNDDKNDQNTDNENKDDENKDNDNKDENKSSITSDKYLIREKEIYKILSDTSISDFKNNITTESTFTILSDDKEITAANEIIKTGMKLKLEDGKEYELIVRGDINCDGKVSLTDLSKLILHYNETTGFILSGSPYDAADMNYDDKVSLTDVSQMLILYNSK